MDSLPAVHKLLSRQLKRENLSEDILPNNLEQWKNLLARVNNTYVQADQERYLLERSMEISSRELMDLNQKLEKAQHIATLGYWFFDDTTKNFFWSKELYLLLGVDVNLLPSWEYFLDKLHEQDRSNFITLCKKSLKEGIGYDCELRMQYANKEYRWFYMACQPSDGAEKTNDLSGIVMDITIRKQAQEKVDLLQDELIVSARYAGMAEVAASVLHNVGNILNSVNVSLGMLQENLKTVYYKKLFSVRDLFKKHKHDIVQYLAEDAQGKLIPEYFIAMTDIMEANYLTSLGELDALSEHITHIKEIVAMQQTLGGTAGVMVKLFLPEVVDTALQMCMSGLKKKNIQLVKKYVEAPFIVTDKIKLLQILVNLIQNAKEAVCYIEGSKEIKIEIHKNKSKEVQIIVSDNGVGIAPENLTKIFSFGFTTKKTGHGFGLHSAALAAKEMKGALQAQSKGIQQGATFILTLPWCEES